MYRNILLCLYGILLISCLSDCKKTATSYTNAKMNGTWIAIGAGTYANAPQLDVFTQFNVFVVNESKLVVFGDTLAYRRTDLNNHTFIFNIDNSFAGKLIESTLTYDYVGGSMQYESQYNTSYSGTEINISTKLYQPNPNLKDYLSNITGTKVLSGLLHDTVSYLAGIDSTTVMTANITFTTINDSTVRFDKNVLGFGDNDLHYKLTDGTGQTVTFQTFHTPDLNQKETTLTYNIQLRTILFEQYDLFGRKRLVLQ